MNRFNINVDLGVIISLHQYLIIFEDHCPDLNYSDSRVLSYNKFPVLPARVSNLFNISFRSELDETNSTTTTHM